MLGDGLKLMAHRFDGYWKDVGTIQSLWEANMELLDDQPGCDLDDEVWKIFSRNPVKPPQYIGETGSLKNSYATEGCEVYGKVEHSILFEGVIVEEGATIKDSIILPGAVIKKGAEVTKAIVGSDSVVGEGAVIGSKADDADSTYNNTKICSDDITLIGPGIKIGDEKKVAVCSMVTADIC